MTETKDQEVVQLQPSAGFPDQVPVAESQVEQADQGSSLSPFAPHQQKDRILTKLFKTYRQH